MDLNRLDGLGFLGQPTSSVAALNAKIYSNINGLGSLSDEPDPNGYFIAVHKVITPGEPVRILYEDESGRLFEAQDEISGLGTLFGKIIKVAVAPIKIAARTITAPIKVTVAAAKAIAKGENVGKAIKGSVKDTASKIKDDLAAINFLNPGTILLRNGVLAAMKLNMFKSAQTLRYGYLTPAQAKAVGVDPVKYVKVLARLQGLQHTFKNWGGNPEKLKDAILKSKKGNGDGKVPLNGLGEPASVGTGAAITAATGFMAALGAVLKPISEMTKKSTPAEAAAPDPTAQEFEAQFTAHGRPENIQASIDAANRSKNLLYGGIGLGVLAVGGTVYYLMSKKAPSARQTTVPAPAPVAAVSGLKIIKAKKTKPVKSSSKKNQKSKLLTINL